MTIELQFLLAQDLKRFGLNPQDWRISSEDFDTYQIAHRLDANFTFRGELDQNAPATWALISLQSL